MKQKDDPLWGAIARWVFGFIRFQLRCGMTLNEIEKRLYEAVGNGELYSFVTMFEDLRSEYAKKNRGEVLNEQRNQ